MNIFVSKFHGGPSGFRVVGMWQDPYGGLVPIDATYSYSGISVAQPIQEWATWIDDGSYPATMACVHVFSVHPGQVQLMGESWDQVMEWYGEISRRMLGRGE